MVKTSMGTQTDNNSKPARVQLDHLLLDVDFFSKPTILAFQFKFGDLAVLSLVKVLCSISRATNANIDPDVAYALGLSKEALEYCIEKKILVTERGLISNTRAIEDQEKLCRAQESWKKSKGRHKDSNSIPNGIHVEIHRSLNTEILNTEDLNKDLENSRPIPQPEISPEDHELNFANQQLVDPNTRAYVRNSSAFMSTGRRPLIKYPELWLTPHELRDVFSFAVEAGLPKQRLDKLFKPVAAWAKGKITSGLPPDRINAFGALTGWGLQEAVKTLKVSKDLERSKSYLKEGKICETAPRQSSGGASSTGARTDFTKMSAVVNSLSKPGGG